MSWFNARLGAGVAAATLTITFALGLPAAAFAGPTPIAWVSESPAPGAVLTAPAPLVGVSAFSAVALQNYTAKITIDGVAYRTLVSNPQSASGHWTYREVWDDDAEEWVAVWTWVVDPDLTKADVYTYANGTAGVLGADGTHTVTATISNASGTIASDTWSYAVRIPPVIGTPTPAPGSQVDTTSPAITLPITDTGSVATWTVTVNGSPASATYTGGILHVALASGLPNDANTTVAVTVTDAVGATSAYAWTFAVQASPSMPNTAGDCQNCHVGFESDADMGAYCLNCHGGTSQPHQGPAANFHVSADVSACRPCHVSSLPTEHAGRTSKSGQPITCMTCHASTDPLVLSAITTGQSQCNSCHPFGGTGHVAIHDSAVASTPIDASGVVCGDCHDGNVMTLHAGVTSASGSTGCNVCHPQPRGAIVGPWNKTCAQADCHKVGTPLAMHASIDASHTPRAGNAACFGAGCHTGTSLATIHSAVNTTTPDGTHVVSCRACHTISGPKTGDCTVCHTTPKADYHLGQDARHTSPTSSSCFGTGCHDASKRLDTVHDRYVGTGARFATYATTCDLCHKNSSPSRIDWTKSPATTCTGTCHSGSTHSQYSTRHRPGTASSSCTGCHGTDLTGIHGAYDVTRCAICHGDRGNFAKTADCVSCHDTSAPHGDIESSHTATLGSAAISIAGSDFGTHQCSECHPSTSLLTIHANNCNTCHPTPKSTLTPSWNKSCVQGGCHSAGSTKPMHGAIDSTHTATAPGCTADGCHAGGTNVALVHARPGCAACHGAGVTPSATCSNCHDTASPHAALPAKHAASAATAMCLGNCHAADLPTEHARSGNGRTPVSCRTCHDTKVVALGGVWDGTCYACHTAQHSDMSQSGNAKCFECHGPSPATISAVATAGAYVNSGGDHQTGYGSSAHGSAVAAGNLGGASTGVQCEACHDHRSDTATGYADFRTRGDVAGANDQSALCFRCHSAGGEETASAGTKPYAWNGRDVKAEFSRVSHHPTVAGPGTTATESVTAFEQTTHQEFATDQLVHATPDLVTGAISLAPTSWVNTYPVTPMVFAQVCDPTFDSYYTPKAVYQYAPSSDTWNSMSYDPPDLPTNTAGWSPISMFNYGGSVYQFALNTDDYARHLFKFLPSDTTQPGSWSDLGNASSWPVAGGQSASDEGHGYLYWTAGYDAVDLVRRHMSDGVTGGVQMKSEAGSWMYLGTGSAAAYSPKADKLFVIDRDGQDPGGTHWMSFAPNGNLWTLASPSTAGSPALMHDTGVPITVAGNAANTTIETRMQRATVAGTDYLFVLGRNMTGSDELRVVSNLGGSTPVVTSVAPWPWPGVIPGYHVSLAWDGGSYLYSSNANQLKRIAIPASPATGSWGAWETLATGPSSPDAFALGFPGAVQPPDTTSYGFEWAGSVSAVACAPQGATSWGTLTWSATSTSTVSVSLQGWNGSAYVQIPGYESVASGTDLSALSTAEWPSLRLTGNLVSPDRTSTPALSSWKLTATRSYPGGVLGSVTAPKLALYDLNPTYTAIDRSTLVSETVPVATITTQTIVGPYPGGRLMFSASTVYSSTLNTYTVEIHQFDPVSETWDNGWDPADLVGYSIGQNYSAWEQSGTLQFTGAWQPSTGRFGALTVTPGQAMASVFTSGYAGQSIRDDVHKVSYSIYSYNNGVTPTKVTIAPFDGSATRSFNLTDPTGHALYYGSCARMAYSPEEDRLYVYQENSYGPWFPTTTYGDGQLYYVPQPWNASGTVTGVYSDIASPSLNKQTWQLDMICMPIQGHDYLVGLLDWSYNWNSQTMWAISKKGPSLNAGATYPWPTRIQYNSSNVQMVADRDKALYVFDNQYKLFKRASTPTTPGASWGAWETLPSGALATAYSPSFAFVDVPAGTFTQTTYGYPQLTETKYSSVATAGPLSLNWDKATWVGSASAGVTTVTVTVQGWNGSAFVDVPGFVGLTSRTIDLSSLSTIAWPRLRLKAVLSTADKYQSPTVSAWTITGGSGENVYQSAEAIAPAGADHWTAASIGWLAPPASGSRVDVQGWNGSAYVTLPGLASVANPKSISLAGLTTADWPRVRMLLRTSADASGTFPALAPVAILGSGTTTQVVGSVTCVSCHDAHGVRTGNGSSWDVARVSDPTGASRSMADESGATMTDFCLKCHTTAAVNASGNVPYAVGFSKQLSSLSFAGWNKDVPGASFKESGHFTTSGTKALCENCHDPHGSNNLSLTAWTKPSSWTTGTPGVRDNTSSAAFEEKLCYQCHGNGTTGKQAPGAQDIATAMTGTYRHPTGDAAYLHDDAETSASVGVGSRHAECADCHDPHGAQPGTHAQGTSIGGAMRGASGVMPTWSSAPGAPATGYTAMRQTGSARDAEAYVCFKCHTSATTLPGSGGSNGLGASDLSREFNPNNAGYHNVLGTPGGGVKTQFTMYGQTITFEFWNNLKPGWTPNSAMSCSDCHTSGIANAKGPHGSSAKYMLDPAYPDDWETSRISAYSPTPISKTLICSKCHDLTSLNEVHAVSGHQYSYTGDPRKCITCHVRIPHGWVRPRLIGYMSDPPQYRSERVVGLTFKRQYNRGTWLVDGCAAACAPHPQTTQNDYGVLYWP